MTGRAAQHIGVREVLVMRVPVALLMAGREARPTGGRAVLRLVTQVERLTMGRAGQRIGGPVVLAPLDRVVLAIRDPGELRRGVQLSVANDRSTQS